MKLKVLVLLCTLHFCTSARYSSYLLDVSPAKVFAHYIPDYMTLEKDAAWGGWNIFNHNPPNDIASSYTPYLGLYSSSDSDYIEYQVQLMKLAGIDGVAINVGIYSVDASDRIKILVEQLVKYKMIATLVYHDSDRFYISAASREERVEAIFNDITEWLEIITNIQFRIRSRPIISILSTSGTKEEVELDENEPRILPSELRTWLNNFPSTTRPIVVGQLFNANYNKVIDGQMEWSTPTSKSKATYKQVQDSRSELIDKIDNNMRTLTVLYHITTVWPGYDDSKTNGWGTEAKYIAYEADIKGNLTYKYLWDSVLELSSPVVFIDSWNNWWNGTAIEPSKENGYKYLEITRNYTSEFKGEAKTSINLKVPEFMYTMRKEADADVQEIGQTVAKLIKEEEYLAAEVLALYYAEKLGMYKPEANFSFNLNTFYTLIISLILISL